MTPMPASTVRRSRQELSASATRSTSFRFDVPEPAAKLGGTRVRMRSALSSEQDGRAAHTARSKPPAHPRHGTLLGRPRRPLLPPYSRLPGAFLAGGLLL